MEDTEEEESIEEERVSPSLSSSHCPPSLSYRHPHVSARGGGAARGPVPHFLCYLLKNDSKNTTRFPTYIGFSTDPLRRLEEHNGQRKGGARRTAGRGPWDLIAVIEGFPNDVLAQQFEWAWTNPKESRLLRGVLQDPSAYRGPTNLTSVSVSSRVRLLFTMCDVEPWRRWGLNIRFTKEENYNLLTSGKNKACRERVPSHISVTWGCLTEMEW